MTAPRLLRSAAHVLLRAACGRLVPGPARNALLIHLLLLRRDADPAPRPAPSRQRVVALAPHMDDETFGCGGTLALGADAGCTVVPVFMCDGTKGYPPSAVAGLAPARVREAEQRLARERKEEARRAAKALGLADPVFLDLPETELAPGPETAGRLAHALAVLEPEVVFLPFFTELNVDHWMTACIFMAAARRAGLPAALPCWGYEVWTPLPANTIVDVAPTIGRKRAAMREYATQIGDYAYPRAFDGLAAYRSLIGRKGRGFVEAFWVAELDLWRRLHEEVAVGARAGLA